MAVNLFGFFLISTILLTACTPTTGTRIVLTQGELKKITSIGVAAKKDQEFSVLLSRQEGTATGAVLFGLVGAAVESAMRHSADTKIEEKFKPIVSDYDLEREFNLSLLQHLQASKFFASAVSVEAKNNPLYADEALDAVLEVTIREWGLRRCVGPGAGLVQVGIAVLGRLLLVGDRRTLWERDELYLDGDCRLWHSFQSQPALKEHLSRTVDDLAGKIINEMLYP